MKKTIDQTIKYLRQNLENLFILLLVLIVSLFAYSNYALFNRPGDPETTRRVQEEISSVDIKFDTKTVNKALELNETGPAVNIEYSGKNPFQTF